MLPVNPIKYFRFFARIRRYSRKVSARTSLTAFEQGREVYRLLRRNRLEPHEYYETYELFHPGLSWEEKTRFLSRNQFALLDLQLNPPDDVGVLNKLVFKVYASRCGLPVAPAYGLFNPGSGYTSEGAPLRTAADLERLFDRPEIDMFLCKPIAADKAEGIVACGKRDGKLLELGAGEIDIPSLYDRMNGSHYGGHRCVPDSWLIEKWVRHHPWFDRFSEDYTHHYRVVTFLTGSGDVQVLGVSMGIGLKGRYVHKSGPLGLSCGFSDDGAMTAAVRSHQDGIKFFDQHPETGARISGERPPGFQECVATACRAHVVLPHLRLLGWDVAFSDEGPVIFEGNTYWNWEKLQCCNRRGIVKGALAEELPEILSGSRVHSGS